MIYLFEDRKYRLDQYYQKELSCDFIKHVESFQCLREEDLDDYIYNNFLDPEADIILFHLSYKFLPNVDFNSDSVKSIFFKNNIPFVYFSGGVLSSTYVENNQLTALINAEDMYSHLDDFIDDFRKKGKVNIPLLAFGRLYKLHYFLHLNEKIWDLLFDANDDDLIEGINRLKIKSLVSNCLNIPEVAIEKEKILQIIDSKSEEKQLRCGFLKNEIQRLLDLK